MPGQIILITLLMSFVGPAFADSNNIFQEMAQLKSTLSSTESYEARSQAFKVFYDSLPLKGQALDEQVEKARDQFEKKQITVAQLRVLETERFNYYELFSSLSWIPASRNEPLKGNECASSLKELRSAGSYEATQGIEPVDDQAKIKDENSVKDMRYHAIQISKRLYRCGK
jgi:hypothetical protein